MRKESRSLLLSLLILLFSAWPASGRIWTDTSGSFHVEAEFVKVSGDSVTLKKPNGDVIKVPLAKLSETDKQFLAQQRAVTPEGGKEATQQPKEAATQAPAHPLLPDNAAKLRSKEVDGLLVAAMHMMEVGQGELAKKKFEEASRTDPGDIRADYIMGLVYALQGRDWKAAEKHFTRCSKRNPGHVGRGQSRPGESTLAR